MSVLLFLAAAAIPALSASPLGVDNAALASAPAQKGGAGDKAGAGPGDLPPAAIPAIAAAAKACIGVAADPTLIAARFANWTATTAGMTAHEIAGMKEAGGRMLTRDNVRVALNPPPDAVCAVLTSITPDFDRQALAAALSQAAGVDVMANAPAKLSTGEIMTAEIGERSAMVLVTTLKTARDNDLPGPSEPAESTPGAPMTTPHQSAPSISNDKGR